MFISVGKNLVSNRKKIISENALLRGDLYP